MLRIHDYKSGVVPAHMEQLMIYAALFCIEYRTKPTEIDMELRIYQADQIVTYVPSANEINDIIDKIIFADKVINKIKNEG